MRVYMYVFIYEQSKRKSPPSHSVRCSAAMQMGSSGPKPTHFVPNAESIIDNSDTINRDRLFATNRGMSSFPWESRGENQHNVLAVEKE